MGAAAKYTLGRIGLFVVIVLALLPVEINLFLKLILALAFSAALSFFLLRGWRDEMAQEMADAADRRKVEKERLRSALAGDDSADAAVDQTGQAKQPKSDQPTADQTKRSKKGPGGKSES